MAALPPTEILVNIFENLPSDDLARVKRACKLFNDIGNLAKLNVKLFIDAPNHAAWKLTRLILANPKFGERIVKISVRWRRRDPNRKKSLTKYWTWNDKERRQIYEVCGTWGLTSDTETAILGGVNAESLLPLLLCLTPNIKILKLNQSDDGDCKHLMDPNWAANRRAIRALNTCMPRHEREHPPTLREAVYNWGCKLSDVVGTDSMHDYFDELRETYRNIVARHCPATDRFGEAGSWFEDNLSTLGRKLPWFAKLDNVKEFCGKEGVVCGKDIDFGHFCVEDTGQDRGRQDRYHELEDWQIYMNSDDEKELDSDDEKFPRHESDTTSPHDEDEDEDEDEDGDGDEDNGSDILASGDESDGGSGGGSSDEFDNLPDPL
ncbi:hypothetical protein TWF281_010166 [Arthrobotrys megalospora]